MWCPTKALDSVLQFVIQLVCFFNHSTGNPHAPQRTPERRTSRIPRRKQQTNQSVSEIIRQALEMYYQEVCQQPVAAKEILSKNGFVGGFEADPELSTSYKTQLQQSLAEKHDSG